MMKYLRHGRLGMIIFEETLSHKEVAEIVGETEEVESAGFIASSRPESTLCFGNSLTLSLTSDSTIDTLKIQRLLTI